VEGKEVTLTSLQLPAVQVLEVERAIELRYLRGRVPLDTGCLARGRLREERQRMENGAGGFMTREEEDLDLEKDGICVDRLSLRPRERAAVCSG
jgi:hypothetical protein